LSQVNMRGGGREIIAIGSMAGPVFGVDGATNEIETGA
jgi:hypothetical protein